MPAATCLRTISRTAEVRHASNAAGCSGRPVSRASRNSSRSEGRGRLPAWVVRIRSVLVFILAIPLRKLGSASVVPYNDRDRAGCTIALVAEPAEPDVGDPVQRSAPVGCLAPRCRARCIRRSRVLLPMPARGSGIRTVVAGHDRVSTFRGKGTVRGGDKGRHPPDQTGQTGTVATATRRQEVSSSKQPITRNYDNGGDVCSTMRER